LNATTPRGRRPWLRIPLTLAVIAALALGALHSAYADDNFLPVEQVFRYTAVSDGRTVSVHWNIAPGYYLYKSRTSVAADTPGFELGAVVFPKGEIHKDDYFGAQEIFRGEFTLSAPLAQRAAGATQLKLKLKLQGCADAGLCYPPQTWDPTITLPANAGAAPTASASTLSQVFNRDRVASNEDDFLPADQAFRLDSIVDSADHVRLIWEIAPGYYLYRSRLKVATPAGAVQVGDLVLPKGQTKSDEFFGTQEVYHQELVAQLALAHQAGALTLPLAVTYQGCAEAGLCYPPITKTLSLNLPTGGSGAVTGGAGSSAGFMSEQDRLAGLVRSGNPLLVLATFFGLGLLLAFTPCVLPMVPILSGIIAGQGSGVSSRRAFFLSLAYVLGMALTNTAAGVLAALAGKQVQAMFQQPWIIAVFAALFIALALSMFGLFTLQMPAAIQTRLSDVSNRQRAGSYAGVAVMGALSALIVTACVGPALVATLAVIGQSGAVLRGGAALFAMSLGMGTPLLAVGASAGKLLPRAGPWMNTVKQFFGVIMLAVAAWILARIVPERVVLLLWAVPALIAAYLLWTGLRRGWLVRAAAVAAGVYGVVLLAGAATGGTDPLAPLPRFGAHQAELSFKTIKTLADLQHEVAAAHAAHRAVLLDFYADWCVSCKEMEKYTFSDRGVQSALGSALLLRADVTRNDVDDQLLLKHFGIIGPPTITFYGTDGLERQNFRVVGYMKAPEFAQVSRRAFGAG
jgi:thiol:disulfide interchange protein DsbD